MKLALSLIAAWLALSIVTATVICLVARRLKQGLPKISESDRKRRAF